MKSTPKIETKLAELCNKGILNKRTENNNYLKVSYCGTGGLVSEKWNVKIYTTDSVVCVDMKTLDDLVNDRLKAPDLSKELISIDDAGWGFPLGGVMIGICIKNSVHIQIIPVEFFRGDFFERKLYLKEYTNAGLNILNHTAFQLQKEIVDPTTHRIEICTGYINRGLKEKLREIGYDVTVTEIKGLLQDTLENKFKEYIKTLTNVDLAYDPKECYNIGMAYKAAVDWGIANAPHLLKTGWKSLHAILI